MKPVVVLFIFYLTLISCSNTENNMFSINGELKKGTDTEYLVLKYIDTTNTEILDTLLLDDGHFFSKGFINGPTRASLIGNLKTRNIEDSNFLNFFIEPNKIDISIVQDDFKNAIIHGSETQLEHENLEEKVFEYRQEIYSLLPERNKLYSLKKENDSDSIRMRLEYLTKLQAKNLNKIRKVYLDYASINLDSHLSSFWIYWYFKSIPKDSVKFYYESFNPNIKDGFYGKSLHDLLEKRLPSRIGDLAPNFIIDDVNGNKLNLQNFRNSYVLLDFWAAWCKPCREDSPELMNLFKKYKNHEFTVIGVSMDKTKEDWRKAIEEDNTESWKHIYIGLKDDTMRTKYNIEEIPEYVLIDKNGLIIGRSSSEHKFTINDLKEKLNEIFE